VPGGIPEVGAPLLVRLGEDLGMDRAASSSPGRAGAAAGGRRRRGRGRAGGRARGGDGPAGMGSAPGTPTSASRRESGRAVFQDACPFRQGASASRPPGRGASSRQPLTNSALTAPGRSRYSRARRTTRERGRPAMSRFVVAFGVLAAVVQAGAVTVPLGTASGGLAIHYNLTGPESPTNQAWVKAQFGPAVSNGALFDFDATVLPGTGGQSWSSIFQSVPHQFGFDVVLTAPTTDGSNPTPVLSAFDNVDGNLAHATNAGPVTWAIDDYQGSPGAPGAGVINSLFRGGTGANDGVTITTQTVTQNGTVFTLHIAGELQSDGLVHWYNPAFGSSPVGSLELTGKLLFDGTLTYDSAGDTGTDRVDFYAGT